MDKVVISPAEIAEAPDVAPTMERMSSLHPSPSRPLIAWWLKLALSPLVLVLPVLCLGSVFLRFLLRNSAPQARIAWLSYLSSHFAVSGGLTTVALVVALSTAPSPSMLSEGLSELDMRTAYPEAHPDRALTTEQLSASFKPLVVVVSPPRQSWFAKTQSPSNVFGAGVVLQATDEGYLIATAGHVVTATTGTEQDAMVASRSGTWSASRVIARHKTLDLLLLWLPRMRGASEFVLPIIALDAVADGSAVYAIGHPQGLRFTLSSGIVSRTDENTIQFTAPISPGNSGGPLLNASGQLAGIVTSMVDRSLYPNAEGLSFAIRADAFLKTQGWVFSGDGSRRLQAFAQMEQQLEKEN